MTQYKLRNWIKPQRLAWLYLNTEPRAIHLLEENPVKIVWSHLSANPAAIHLLEANPKKIDWWELSKNPEIFEYDYKKMVRPFKEELIAVCYHPDNFRRLL